MADDKNMSGDLQEKAFRLQSDWKYYLLSYIGAVLTIPLFGIGLAVFYFSWKRHHSEYYEITDRRISAITSSWRRNIDLVQIEQIRVEQNWLNRQLDVGSLVLATHSVEMKLRGIARPAALRQMIEQAAAALRKQAQQQPKKRPEPAFKPGSMDRLDYLTGLWQQGLMSDQDYKKERKHFE